MLKQKILGKEEKFDFADRYFLQTAEAAMKGDIVRGLVELITNSDDSYGHMEDAGHHPTGEIVVEVERRRKGQDTIIRVHDYAEGMNMEDMVKKLKRVGGMTSGFESTHGKRTRGLMGRGSKECVIFGPMKFQSIKAGIYSEIRLEPPASFIRIRNAKASSADKLELGMPQANTTMVTLDVRSRFRIPTHDVLARNLSKYYSLRDIAASKSRNIRLIDNGGRHKPIQVVYAPLNGEVVIDDTFQIPGYADAQAHFRLMKVKERIKADASSPYWEGGILVKSGYAIHGVTALSKDIENNPYFEFYFGKLECQYIDDLALQYEAQEERKEGHSEKNPIRIIDPLRAEGLTSSHPFTKALYGAAAILVKERLKKDEEGAVRGKDIENKDTADRLARLAREAGRFIREQSDDLEQDDDSYLDPSEIPAGGIRVVPNGTRVILGDERRFYIYVRPLNEKVERHVLLSSNSTDIQISTKTVYLLDGERGILTGSFTASGIAPTSEALINLTWGEVKVHVKIVVDQEIIFPEIPDLDFENKIYNVRVGKQKQIKIIAKWPEYIHGEIDLVIQVKDNRFFELGSKSVRLKYEKRADGQSMAVGVLRVIGKEAGGEGILTAEHLGKKISAKIRTIPKAEFGKNFDIKIVNEDLGDQRAAWLGNTLKINGRHSNLQRYLGAPENNFPGQNSLHFKILIAELIADGVARKILEPKLSKLENLDVTTFYKEHRKYMNQFLDIAHKIQAPDQDLTN